MGWLTWGLLAGVIYGVVDTAMDVSLLPAAESSLAFNAVHRFFNMMTPPVAGMAVGVLFAYMRQRDARVAAERRVSEALRERLKGAERQQAVWLVASSLLHDVRNPLHALGLLIDEASDSKNAELARAALDRARTQADRIEQRIRSLREMAESPPRERVRLDVATVVTTLVADLHDTASRSGVALELGKVPSVEVEADERYVRTPLENLLMNAIRAASSAPDARVRVEVELKGRELQVVVSDNGPGIPQEIVAVLFEPLHASKNLGLGLGLPLARALARLEGGDVRLLRNGPPETALALMLPLPVDAKIVEDPG
jgi:two-component system, LuxR family, sensor kinase FixL